MTFWILLIGTWVVLLGAGGLALYIGDRVDRDHQDLTEHQAERRAMARAVERCRHHHPTARTRETIR